LLLDHGRVLRRAGITVRSLCSRSWQELSGRRFLVADRVAASPRPRYVLAHER
jgi:hypothetical protein